MGPNSLRRKRTPSTSFYPRRRHHQPWINSILPVSNLFASIDHGLNRHCSFWSILGPANAIRARIGNKTNNSSTGSMRLWDAERSQKICQKIIHAFYGWSMDGDHAGGITLWIKGSRRLRVRLMTCMGTSVDAPDPEICATGW
jgi:hypothetical protein